MFLLEKYISAARCHCFNSTFFGTKDNPQGSFIATSYWLSKNILSLLCYILIVKSLYTKTI